MRQPPCVVVLAAAALALACDQRLCADTSEESQALPERLSQTGLFASLPSARLAARVYPYEPEFELWSDGAEKQRWVYVPEDSRIDVTDADAWRFPVGTKLWKEFSRDGVRLETRLLQKLGAGDSDWAAVAYIWRADQSDALKAAYGAINARGTAHDVPAAGECWACHAGRRNKVLGFSAIQLAPRTSTGTARIAANMPAEAMSEPALNPIEIPGEPSEREALGYLHANCSHCHNQAAAVPAAKCLDPNSELSFDLDFSLSATELTSTDATGAYRTAIGRVIEAGDPEASKVIKLMSGRGAFRQMPPLGTERVDLQGLQVMRAWIAAL